MDSLERRQRRIDEKAGRGDVDFAGIIGKLTREQMLGSVHEMLTDVCYETVAPGQVGSVTPDFRARRQGEKCAYEIVGVLCMSPDEVIKAYEKLVEMEKALGNKGRVCHGSPPDA